MVCERYGWKIKYTESIGSDWMDFMMRMFEEEAKQSKLSQK